MPPRTRTAKTTKGLKENAVVHANNTKSKGQAKDSKAARKPLADKTNSASDDNGSTVAVKKPTATSKSKAEKENQVRPKRERRVPTRFAENKVLKNLSINQDSVSEDSNKSKSEKNVPPVQKPAKSEAKPKNTPKSPFKTPNNSLNGSLLTARPKRIHRLPSRFEDHSISPTKFIPVQPCFASTPLAKHNEGKVLKNISEKKETPKPVAKENNPQKRPIYATDSKNVPEKKKDTPNPVSKGNSPQKRPIYATESSNKKSSPAKQVRPMRSARVAKKSIVDKDTTPKSSSSLETSFEDNGRVTKKNFSFRVLEKKGGSPKQIEEKLAVYEFTFDPNEEPKPQKKKRKRVVKKKTAPKPKTVVFKSNYDSNIAKTLESLRNVVKKTTNGTVESSPGKTTSKKQVTAPEPQEGITSLSTTTKASVHNNNDTQELEPPMDYNNINYSPVGSPSNSPRPHAKMSAVNETRDQLRTTRAKSLMRPNHSHDPLNLCEELSYFEDEPVASSSMRINTSVRDPLASPWRVEFSALPIKWQANTYVKANMTPAVESSFINPNDVQKRHVYTNMVPQNDSLPDIVTNDKETTNWKQPSLIEFFREAALKSANKKNKKSSTPTKNKATPTNAIMHSSIDQNVTPPDNIVPEAEQSNVSKNNSSIEASVKSTPLKRKGDEMPSDIPEKSPRIEKENDQFFGFDDSENQENVSPKKKDNQRARSLRSRARPVLQEINAIGGPCRANIPLAAKTRFGPSSETVNKLFGEMKSASEAPQLSEKEKEVETSTTTDPSWSESVEEPNEESVHLFEDIDVVHHMKPPRKSYGKGKKLVTFCQTAVQETAIQSDQDLSEDEETDDLPFDNPTIKMKKVVPKKKKKKGPKLTKKEEEEVEAWAAAFNSMCEDVDDFDLLVE